MVAETFRIGVNQVLTIAERNHDRREGEICKSTHGDRITRNVVDDDNACRTRRFYVGDFIDKEATFLVR